MQVKERKVFPQLAVKKERKTKETKHRGLEIPLAALRYVLFLSMWWPFTLYSIVCINIYIYMYLFVSRTSQMTAMMKRNSHLKKSISYQNYTCCFCKYVFLWHPKYTYISNSILWKQCTLHILLRKLFCIYNPFFSYWYPFYPFVITIFWYKVYHCIESTATDRNNLLVSS